jgi:hypothetical protein
MQSAAQQHAEDSATSQKELMQLLTDAHCHPQLDPANLHAVVGLQSSKLAAMSVSYDVDWDIMLQLHKLAGVPGTRRGTIQWDTKGGGVSGG